METVYALPVQAMEKGTYVRVKGTPPSGDTMLEGKIAVISDALPTSDNRIWVKFLNQSYDLGDIECLITVSNLEVLPDQAAAPQMRELEAWQSRYKYQTMRVKKYQEGVEKLGEYAMEIADHHDYCEQYDEVVDALNERLDRAGHNLVRLPVREQEYEVTINVRATIWASTTVMVSARNADDAADLVRNDPEDYTDIGDLLSDTLANETPDYDIEVEI